MIESRLDVLTDGYGDATRAPDMTVAKVARQFQYLAVEGQGRSASAVLRIVSEQSEGRKTHANLPNLLWLLTAFTILVAFVAAREPQRADESLIVALILNAAFAALIWVTRKRRRRIVAQLDEIRRLAVATLDVVVAKPGFVPKPLDKQNRRTFASLRQTDPEAWNRIATALARGME